MVSARNRRVLRARGAVDRVKGYTIVDADFSSPAILVAVEAMGLCFPDVSTLSFCFFAVLFETNYLRMYWTDLQQIFRIW